MESLKSMSKNQLTRLLALYQNKFDELKTKNLKLDLSRGKPDNAQLDLSMKIFSVVTEDSPLISETGMDCRNYGLLRGITEAKKLMGDVLDVSIDKIIIGGNSSLNLMYDTLMRSMVFGVDGNVPFMRQEKIKFLCPAPGYDRHFAITQDLGFELITVPMTDDGPDMDIVEEYVKDKTVKGIWCVPKYSNPTGCIYSDETVKRFAALKPAAKDFRIYWDNAYCLHFLYPEKDKGILNIIDECEKAGNPDLAIEFTSTSKISFAGSGISAMVSSVKNIKEAEQHMTYQTIGFDKINQLRHALFFKDKDGIHKHMCMHANLLRPKFEAVLNILDREFSDKGICSYTRPDGGYFISFDSMPGCAKEIVKLCKEGGVVLTNAGATYPYGIDPNDSNIRIAPSYAKLDEIIAAMELFCVCVYVVTIKKLLEE